MRKAKRAKYDFDVEIDPTSNEIEFKTEFLHLNDDCIRHILEWLPINDLSNIYDTCTRLRSVASGPYKTIPKYVFVKRPSHWIDCCVIRCYSEHIQKLKIDYWEYNSTMEQQIDKINSNTVGRIAHLKLCNFVLCASYVQRIKDILQFVRKIEFKYSKMDGAFHQLILRNCPNLKELTFKRCRGMLYTWFKTKYNLLDSLTILRDNHLFESSLRSYFKKNPKAKELTYASIGRQSSIKWASACLLENIDKIEKIKLSGRSDDIVSLELVELSRQGVLKECNFDFELDFYQDDTVEAFLNSISSHDTFEVLGLFRRRRIDHELYQAVCNLTHIKVLKLYGAHDLSQYMEGFAKKLINLKSLFIRHCDIQCHDLSTFICNSTKLENIFVGYCQHVNWIKLTDELQSLKQRTRPVGAGSLTLHVYVDQLLRYPEYITEERHRQDANRMDSVVVTMRNNCTIKMNHLPQNCEEMYFQPEISIGITFK